jgi:cell division protease FtsH
MIYYGDDGGDEVFLGRDLGHARSYGENVATLIDQEVKGIIDECYEDTKRILLENMDVLHKCAALLLEKERIDRTEFEELFAAKTLEEA